MNTTRTISERTGALLLSARQAVSRAQRHRSSTATSPATSTRRCKLTSEPPRRRGVTAQAWLSHSAYGRGKLSAHW